MDQMGSHRAHGGRFCGEHEFLVRLQQALRSFIEQPVHALDVAEREREHQCVRMAPPARKVVPPCMSRWRSSVAYSRAMVSPSMINWATPDNFPPTAGAQWHIDFQQGGAFVRPVQLRDQIEGGQPRSGVKMADRIKPAQGGEIFPRQDGFRDARGEGIREGAARGEQPDAQHALTFQARELQNKVKFLRWIIQTGGTLLSGFLRVLLDLGQCGERLTGPRGHLFADPLPEMEARGENGGAQHHQGQTDHQQGQLL